MNFKDTLRSEALFFTAGMSSAVHTLDGHQAVCVVSTFWCGATCYYSTHLPMREPILISSVSTKADGYEVQKTALEQLW